MHDLSQILWICYVVCTKVNSSFERSNYTAFILFALISGEPHTLLDLGSGVYCGILETPPKLTAKINRSKPQKKKMESEIKKANSNKHDHFFLLEARASFPLYSNSEGGRKRGIILRFWETAHLPFP